MYCDKKRALIHGVDASTFQVYAGSRYAKDAHRVYYPKLVLCAEGVNCGQCFYVRVVSEGADPLTFEVLKSDYGKDSQWVYYKGMRLDSVDYDTFEVIGDRGKSRDKFSFYETLREYLLGS